MREKELRDFRSFSAKKKKEYKLEIIIVISELVVWIHEISRYDILNFKQTHRSQEAVVYFVGLLQLALISFRHQQHGFFLYRPETQ